jgi:transcriptional regulator with XRE-family HTH domain
MRRQRSYSPNRIAELRRARGLSLRTFANLVGTTPSTLSKLERSEIRLSVDWMNKLAPHLGVDPADLGGWGDPRPVGPPRPMTPLQGEQLVDINYFHRAVLDACRVIMETTEHAEIHPKAFPQIFVNLAFHCLGAGYKKNVLDKQFLMNLVLALLGVVPEADQARMAAEERRKAAEESRKAYGT